MAEQTKRAELWSEVEHIAQEWQVSLKIGYPLIPLLDLQPLWNSAVAGGIHIKDRLRLEAQGHENLLLKVEIARLKRELELVTGNMRFPASTERRRIDRRRAN